MSREAKHRADHAAEPIAIPTEPAMPVQQAAEFSYPQDDMVDLRGQSRGTVNLSKVPPLQNSTEVAKSGLDHYSFGEHVGTVILPPPPGVIYTAEEVEEQNYHLSVHIFDTGLPVGSHVTPEQPRYVLISSEAMSQLGAIATGGQDREAPLEGEGIVTMSEGSVLQVGREHWLPSLGTAVGLQEMDTKMQRIYSGVSREHGVFRMQDGELIWEDHGMNGSTFVHSPDLGPEHAADQSFMATQHMIAPERQPEIASVFDGISPEALFQTYDEPTGQPPNWPA